MTVNNHNLIDRRLAISLEYIDKKCQESGISHDLIIKDIRRYTENLRGLRIREITIPLELIMPQFVFPVIFEIMDRIAFAPIYNRSKNINDLLNFPSIDFLLNKPFPDKVCIKSFAIPGSILIPISECPSLVFEDSIIDNHLINKMEEQDTLEARYNKNIKELMKINNKRI